MNVLTCLLRLLYHSPVAPPSIPLTRWRVASSKGKDANPCVWHTHKKKHTQASRTPSLIQVQGRCPSDDATSKRVKNPKSMILHKVWGSKKTSTPSIIRPRNGGGGYLGGRLIFFSTLSRVISFKLDLKVVSDQCLKIANQNFRHSRTEKGVALVFELFIGKFFFMLDTHTPLQKKTVYKICVLITLPQTEFALCGFINTLV